MVAADTRRLDRTLAHLRPAHAPPPPAPAHQRSPCAARSPCAVHSAPPAFEPCQRQQILAHFQEFGFAVVCAIGTDEVGRVNRWIDESQRACPAAWLGSGPGAQQVPNAMLELPTTGSISYSLPLLDPAGSELDSFVRLPSTASIVDEILEGEAAYAEFDFRETRDRDGAGQMLFHHDFGAAGASQPGKIRDRTRRCRHDYICQIVYLTDVTPSSPAFAVLPYSHRVPCWPDESGGSAAVPTSNDASGVRDGEWPFREPHEEKQLRKALGSRFAPVRVEGGAGTAVLYDISLFHTRSDPVGAGCGLRRTMHTYFCRQSVPPLIDWGLIPTRLASDPFFANQCAAQKHFAALGSSVDVMLQHEGALRGKLTGAYSTTESVLSKIRHLAVTN